MEKRYLVYKTWNGQIHTSIEYGQLTTGEGNAIDDPNELKKINITDSEETDLNKLKELFPLNLKLEDCI